MDVHHYQFDEILKDNTHAILKDNSHAQLFLLLTSIAFGVLLCKTLYSLTKAITPFFFKGFAKLTKAQQIEWNNRGISTGHAVLVTAISIYLLFISDIFRDEAQDVPVALRNTPLSTFFLGVSAGYFLTDLAMIVWLYPMLGGMEYILHHLLSICAIFLSLFSGDAHVYVYMVLLSESTTPGVNLRWYLDTAGLKKSKLYVINGVVMFFAWLVARIILFIYLFYHMYMHYDEIQLICLAGFYYLFVAPPVLAIMNAYWFWRILLGLKKTLSKRA